MSVVSYPSWRSNGTLWLVALLPLAMLTEACPMPPERRPMPPWPVPVAHVCAGHPCGSASAAPAVASPMR